MTPHPSAPAWYVLYTKPWKERLVESMISERLRLQVYLPEVMQVQRGKWQMAPFFPRYLFVLTDLDQTGATEINRIPGVVGLVELAGRPQPVSTDLLDKIRGLVEDYNAEGGLPLHRFYPGEPVRFTAGPLQGLHGTFVRHLNRKQRVLILLTLLGQQNEIELDAALLERINTQSPQEKRRRTRGKGRRIHYSDTPPTP